MKTNILTITAICATMLACNSKNEITNRVELPGTVDNEAFAANVESISVMNLQMDDKWSLAGGQLLAFADNYTYLLESNQRILICFDKLTGEIIKTRSINGNGPGEIIYINSMFCIGDTLCIYDIKGNILQYDKNCTFLGKMHEFEDSGLSYYKLLRLNSGDYALISPFSFSTDTISTIFLTDEQFNIKSRHFKSPQFKMVLQSGNANPYYVNNDTIRFIYPYDNNIYSLYGDTEQRIELMLPNPMTVQTAGNPDFLSKFTEYDGWFNELSESGRFILFKYRINNVEHISMLDKRAYNAVSISNIGFISKKCSSDIISTLLKYINILQTDGKYIYARYRNCDLANLLEGHDDILDTRLKKTQAEYRAYLERNAEYVKSLEPEERDAANVILKIKLKD